MTLPVSLLLGAMLTTAVVAIGMACMEQVERTERTRQAVEDFNGFVEAVRLLALGGDGGERSVAVRGEGKIVVDGNIAQLELSGGVLRAGILPIPTLTRATLSTGTHVLRVKRGSDGLLRFWVEAGGVG